MFHIKYFIYFILLHLIIATPRINLYYTDWITEKASQSDNTLPHSCLRTDPEIVDEHFDQNVVYYCMNEFPSKFNDENDDSIPKFNFAELSKGNITSEQLYLWSTPIDIIERYQFYLNQLLTSNDSSLAKQIFYNCTLPRFGPMCQYEFDFYHPDYPSLEKMIRDFYSENEYKLTSLTCYIHVQCNLGPFASCLDWSDICDEKVDCLDSASDEEHCWQLEINECKDDEYRCTNGQCIPLSFFRETDHDLECPDSSDRIRQLPEFTTYTCYVPTPSMPCDDVRCDYTHLTSSCLTSRKDLLLKVMYSIQDNSVSKDCWSALKCIFNIPHSEYPSCAELCEQNVCIEIIQNNCPDMLFFPNVPVFSGHVYFAFRKSDSQYFTTENIGLLYICYNDSRYNSLFNMASKVLFNNTMCFVHETISYPSSWSQLWRIKPRAPLRKLYHELNKYQLIFNYTSEFCNRSNMYRCVNSSKCISIYRHMNGIYDCPHMDDENNSMINDIDVIEKLKKSYFKCQTSNKYIHQLLIKNGECDCGYIISDWCDDEESSSFNPRKSISFQTICDGFAELTAIVINGSNETDETECEQWQCNNIYTRCNQIWNCHNGADEAGCPLQIPFNCSADHHICVSPYTNQLICLSLDKVNNGKIDCLGAYDEPILCRSNTLVNADENHFHCMNPTGQSCIPDIYLCDGYKHCEHGDDEQFCTTNKTVSVNNGICWGGGVSYVEIVLCHFINEIQKAHHIHFLLHRVEIPVKPVAKNMKNPVYTGSSIIAMFDQYQPRCHRGLDLRVWLNNKNNSTTMTCLCPPSFYGDRCQYQNQRISLTIKFRALSDSWQTLFVIFISLIDDSDERIIHSYERITYLWTANCQSKFNIYLLYSTQPKNATKNYSVHIDIYEKAPLAYRGSLLLPVNFPFLPVHRLAFFVDIPRSDDKIQRCSNDQCIHGKCIRYSNNPVNESFCKCDHGWSGRYCTIQHICTCAFDSLCIGISANNRSICVCPENKFGSRCLITDTTCETNNNSTCQNNGQCISTNYVMLRQKFMCICPEGFSGYRCEIVNDKLVLSFDKVIVLSQSIFIHFIDLTAPEDIVRSTTFRTIPVRQDSVTIYSARPFHVVLTELFNRTYYLTVVQYYGYDQPVTIKKTIQPSDRCLNINELFNETFLQWHPLRRIKYYHLPCQQQSLNLSCFYDDVHLCLCYTFGEKRLANCLNFDHNMTFDCDGRSECENGGQCFQDGLICATRSVCLCRPCFYGRRCQFSTSGFGLSFDALLGYHILPDAGIIHQSPIVQFSLALIIIFSVAGLINGVLSLITFKNKSTREVGCGLYLLNSSITSLLTMMMCGLKFFILLLSQMTMISNRSFLQIQCTSLDFILQICLNMDQWLNACVAAERAVTTIKGPGFVKKKSKQAAKFVIVILLIVIVGTNVHDAIYRRLIDETNEDDDVKRIWCIVTYSSSLEVYNYVIHCFHFFGPFLINLVSAITLILQKSRQQSNLHKKRPYKEILGEQFQEHKRLLIAPIVLVLLAFPRLIIAFVSKCMKSANDSWLFLIGYFISFIPPMLTFIIFVLPSEFYKKEFRKSIERYRTTIQRRLHLIP